MLFQCPHGCSVDIGMTRAKQGLHRCELHGAVLTYTKSLGSKAGKKRAPMKRGKGLAASPTQRKRVEGLPCAGCSGLVHGRDLGSAEDWAGPRADPAHLWPRGMGGCDDPLCVIPLCRDCHRRLDDPSDEFDLLPSLLDRGYYAELAHAIEAHELSPLTLLERLTGQEWQAVLSHTAKEAA